MDRDFLIDNLINFLLMEKQGEGANMDLEAVARLFAKAGYANCFTLDNVGFADQILAALARGPGD